jgi:hypothetical protein
MPHDITKPRKFSGSPPLKPKPAQIAGAVEHACACSEILKPNVVQHDADLLNDIAKSREFRGNQP